jgi:hypothetical protein
MSAKIPTAGDIIDAYCTSCRTVMNHTIVSMVETRPARVQCNTCNGVHNYRKEKTAGTAAKASATKVSIRQPRKEPGKTAHQEWAKLQFGQDGARVALYDMKASYKVGNHVNHPKFGLGIVKQLAGANKVEILFEEGLKLLRCG